MRLPVWLEKCAGILAPVSFGVYLIHLHPMVRNHLLLDRFRPLLEYPAWSRIPLVLGVTFVIYLVCNGVDMLHYGFFQKLEIKHWLGQEKTNSNTH